MPAASLGAAGTSAQWCDARLGALNRTRTCDLWIRFRLFITKFESQEYKDLFVGQQEGPINQKGGDWCVTLASSSPSSRSDTASLRRQTDNSHKSEPTYPVSYSNRCQSPRRHVGGSVVWAGQYPDPETRYSHSGIALAISTCKLYTHKWDITTACVGCGAIC